jgi:hypothetical protein
MEKKKRKKKAVKTEAKPAPVVLQIQDSKMGSSTKFQIPKELIRNG